MKLTTFAKKYGVEILESTNDCTGKLIQKACLGEDCVIRDITFERGAEITGIVEIKDSVPVSATSKFQNIFEGEQLTINVDPDMELESWLEMKKRTER